MDSSPAENDRETSTCGLAVRSVGSPPGIGAKLTPHEPAGGRAVLLHRPDFGAERQLSPTGFMGSSGMGWASATTSDGGDGGSAAGFFRNLKNRLFQSLMMSVLNASLALVVS